MLTEVKKAVWRESTKAFKSTAATGFSLELEAITTAHEQAGTTSSSGIREHALGSDGDDETILIDETHLDFPEGGTPAYLTVFGSFMGLIPAFGMVNSVGAIEAYVSNHQLKDVSTSTVSWIFSIYTFIAFSSCIFSGTFFDRSGAFKPMLIGSITFCGGMLATANCTRVYQFILAFGVLVGFGTGMLMSPLVGAVSHFFYKKRATATSIATTGGSLGGIIMPLMLRKMYSTVGFIWALRALTLFCACCLVLALIFTKERLHREDNSKIDSWKGFFKVYFVDAFDYKSLSELKFMSCAIGVAFAEGSLVVVLIYLPSYAIMQGNSEQTSFLLIIVSNTCAILGRYIPGIAADRLGRFNVVILTVSMCALISLVLWLPFGKSLKVLYAFSGLYGFFSGSILSLSPVCCGQISRTEEFGKRYSTMYLISSFTMLTLIPIAGTVIGEGAQRNYNNFIGFSVALLGLAIMSYIVCRHACVGWRLCKF